MDEKTKMKTNNTEFRIKQFRKFHHFLVKDSPEGYLPWIFTCAKEGKNPLVGVSWHDEKARLSKEQAIEKIKLGYNLGISAREGDPLIIGDIDEAEYMDQLPTDTLTSTSRKRSGGHFFGWDKDGTAKINLPSDYGEMRSNNQYVLAPGSYVPFNLESEKDKKAFDSLPKEAREDEFMGYYTVRNAEELKQIAFSDLPEFFKQKESENIEIESEIKQRDELKEFKGEGKYSQLFNLKVSDIIGKIPSSKRKGHPLHESDTDANFSLSKDGCLGHCWRHLGSLNSVQYLCVKVGYSKCEDAGTPHKGRGLSKIKGDKKALEVAYQEALKMGLIEEYKEKEEENIELEVYTDKDLRDYKPEPMIWLIENQIPKAEIGLLVGKRGVRKTFTALYQAICLASGKKCLEDNVPEKKKVLIIDEENGKNELAKRVRLLKSGLNIDEDLDISFMSFENIKLNEITTKRYELLEDYILENKPDLIIVDCLQRVVTLEVDRDNAGISAFFTGVVRRLTKKVGCSWLFIHHMRKGNSQYQPEDQLDEIRGGSELVNYCRYVLMCEEPKKTKAKEEKTLVLFKPLKMSNALLPPPKVYEFLSDENKIILDYIGSPEEVLNTEAKIGDAIKNYIIEKEMTGEFKTGQITESWEEIGFKRSSLHLGLKWLEEKGEIVKERRGIWRLASDEEL